jgi:hypothetical protein
VSVESHAYYSAGATKIARLAHQYSAQMQPRPATRTSPSAPHRNGPPKARNRCDAQCSTINLPAAMCRPYNKAVCELVPRDFAPLGHACFTDRSSPCMRQTYRNGYGLGARRPKMVKTSFQDLGTRTQGAFNGPHPHCRYMLLPAVVCCMPHNAPGRTQPKQCPANKHLSTQLAARLMSQRHVAASGHTAAQRTQHKQRR